MQSMFNPRLRWRPRALGLLAATAACLLVAGCGGSRPHDVGARRIDGDPRGDAASRERCRKQGRADRAVGLRRGNIAARHEEAGD